MGIINWNILKHPLNWVTVTVMVMVAAIALHLILSWQTNPTSATTPQS